MSPLSGIKIGLTLSAVMAIGTLGLGCKVLAGKLHKALEERDTAYAIAEQNARVIGEIRDQRDKDIAGLGRLSDQLRQARDTASQAIERLEELKRNEQMVQADPAGVERLINARLRGMFDVLSCASGRVSPDCAGAAAPPGAAPAAGPTTTGAGAEHP